MCTQLVTIGTGLAFGLVHVLNPEWSAASLASVSLAGLLLGWTMVASRNLLVPIGLHVAWNLVQSLLTTRQFWEVTRAEDVWLSGGREGLEASAAGLTITGLGAAVALAVAVRRSRNGGAAPAPGTPAP
jgi:xanthosine utilization system XapX-like protein